MQLLTKLFNFITLSTKNLLIDESHGIKHSMDILNYAHNIYKNEIKNYPIIKDHERIIYVSALIHDMCDKKYVNENDGIKRIEKFLQYKIPPYEIKVIKDIISSMSYSTVKKKGYPKLDEYQMAYHIVREADLLTAYDFDRSIIYHMYKSEGDFIKSYDNAVDLFNNRVLKHHTDDLFITEYSKKKGMELHNNALLQMQSWKKIINTYDGTFIL
jgi:hypothetical protein